ncbi:MAG: SDR family NAD(P)-dependent oxidoreductase [Psychroserpens sp.]|uniref:SDR family NAD(P)-dependent oxidoreductase n=1 Tax=Psychroserpens sp. TaxID=2020870 RepID=UPI003002698E
MKTFNKKYGSWALVTGASSGIGKEYATHIASQGLNIVLVARNEKKLRSIEKELISIYQVNVEVIVADLTIEADIETLFKKTNDLEIGLLVNNAGREDSNHFIKIPVKQHLGTIDLNIKTPLVLTHHFGVKMIERKKGGIINMSSIVAFQGVPYIANYAGTKAFNLIFSEGIASEFKKYNIDVLAVTPGFTKTNLAKVYDFTGTPFKPLEPGFVAKKALKYLGRKRLCIPGFINAFLYWSGKFLFTRHMNTTSFGMVFKKVLKNTL